MDEELARRVQTFRDQGFTVFSGLFDLAQVERWRAAFDGLAEQGHLVGGGQSTWVRDLLERAPKRPYRR